MTQRVAGKKIQGRGGELIKGPLFAILTLPSFLPPPISQILNNAISADGIVKGKYGENKEGFLLLSKGEADLSSSLPSASPAAALQGSPVVSGNKLEPHFAHFVDHHQRARV